MSELLRHDAQQIIDESIKTVLPEAAVIKALGERKFGAGVLVIAIGKAAWRMAHAATQVLGNQIRTGLVVTKYGHVLGSIDRFEIIEAGHPLPDANSVRAADRALEMLTQLQPDEEVLVLISGGGSALFEKPLAGLSLAEIAEITSQLLACGASIAEINTVRKHLSAVKGGRFAQSCGGAKLYTIVLSDVLGDRIDTIASGPTCPDSSTSGEALEIVVKYRLKTSEKLVEALKTETPKAIANSKIRVAGNVASLCTAAAMEAEKLGYQAVILSSSVDGEAREFGQFLASVLREMKNRRWNHYALKPPLALIFGGETVVRLKGNGRGGRNQELALAAAIGIEGLDDVLIFSLGSDGTDGPTDAAGGMVDGGSVARMRAGCVDPEQFLNNNDSYNALKASGDLLITGPTGTNVNDLMVILCR